MISYLDFHRYEKTLRTDFERFTLSLWIWWIACYVVNMCLRKFWYLISLIPIVLIFGFLWNLAHDLPYYVAKTPFFFVISLLDLITDCMVLIKFFEKQTNNMNETGSKPILSVR